VYPGDLVKYPFPPILVNIGDMLSYWTDGLLKSTVHRVVFPREMPESSESGPRDRYSIAFFCQPVGSTELVPVPSKLVENYRESQNKDPNKSYIVGYGGGANSLDSDQPRMTAGEHLQSRLNATYLKSI
jgi:isopenicillin N synthase-like dioxygenase